jgi:hypothetical protein
MNDNTKPSIPMPLSTRHASWIVGWALDHCVESIAKLESERARHIANREMLEYTRMGKQSRDHRMQEINDVLRQYHICFDFLMASKEMVANKSSEEFARDMAAMFKHRKGK